MQWKFKNSDPIFQSQIVDINDFAITEFNQHVSITYSNIAYFLATLLFSLIKIKL